MVEREEQGGSAVARYKLGLVRDLARELRLSPREQRQLQLRRLEHLVRDVEPGKRYPASFVVYRLTLYGPPGAAAMCDGGELKADLVTLLDELSGTLDLPSPRDASAELLTLEQIKDAYDVSDKTLAEWRAAGLMTKRYIFPDGVQRSAAPRAQVDAFIASLGQGPIYQVRIPNEKQKRVILEEARALAQAGNLSMPEAERRLSAKVGLPARLVRHAIRSYEMEHPDEVLFPRSGVPLDAARRKGLWAAHQAGKAEAEIARAIGLSRKQVAQYLRTLRAEELLRADIDYRYDPLFDAPDADRVILSAPALGRAGYKTAEPPGAVPAYFADLSHLPPLSGDEETALFRKYNYIKYKFTRLCESLTPSEGDAPELIARLEALAADAGRCRARLVEANLRLVVKLARQHAGSIVGTDELISEGNLSLLRAVEKFDFTRGTRFSTYATWCVVKRFARVVPEENYRIDTFMTGADEVIEIQPDRTVVELERSENLAHMRAQLNRVMAALSAREREILMRRFGLGGPGGQPQTLEEIGQTLGITRERVRQIETRALRKAADLIRLQGI